MSTNPKPTATPEAEKEAPKMFLLTYCVSNGKYINERYKNELKAREAFKDVSSLPSCSSAILEDISTARQVPLDRFTR